jgi:methylated-DNA-protein-cysteine methyltransferase related protein
MGSPFFGRIKADVLKVMASVPAGRVVSFADVGTHLDIVPRHVAYILAMLSDIEKATLPWHRAVAAEGTLGTPKCGADGESQRQLLAAEGAAFDAEGRITDFAARQLAVADLPHGIAKQSRPANAPQPRRGRGAPTARETTRR